MALPQQKPEYRADIDGLRAVAVLCVVIFHAFPGLLRGGFVGVDVFFVISGYLISGIIFRGLLNGNFSFSTFYGHRVKRIFPALFLVLAASFAAGWFVLLPQEFTQLGKHIATGAGFVQNFALWFEDGYFNTVTELKPLMHLWSLAVEEQFYIVYPILICLLWRARINLLASIVVIAVTSFVLNITTISTDSVRVFFSPQYRFWEIMAGCVLSYIQVFQQSKAATFVRMCFKRAPTNLQGSRLNDLASMGGLILILGTAGAVSKQVLFPGWWALPPVLGACLLIAAGPGAWVNRKLLSHPAAVFVGLISYPLYLWHWPLLSFARITESSTPSAIIRASAVVIAIILSWATYRFVERPIRYRARWPHVTPALCSLMIVVAGVGYATKINGGFSFRQERLIEANSQFGWEGLVFNQDCANAFPQLAGEHCNLSKPADPTIALLGDSHSNAIYPGLAELASLKDEVVVNFARGGCTPFFDVSSFERGKTDYCADYTNRALEFSERHPSIRTIVLSSRGPLYITGKGYNERYDWILASPDAPKAATFRDVYEAGMRKTFDRLSKSGKTIVFVIDVPELGFNPRACVPTRPWSITGQTKEPCAITRAEYDRRNAAYRAVVKKVAASFPAVKVVDPSRVFCDDEYCWAMKDGKLTYRDGNHLSVFGSSLVAQQIFPDVLHGTSPR